jgi:hypothetical protein
VLEGTYFCVLVLTELEEEVTREDEFRLGYFLTISRGTLGPTSMGMTTFRDEDRDRVSVLDRIADEEDTDRDKYFFTLERKLLSTEVPDRERTGIFDSSELEPYLW